MTIFTLILSKVWSTAKMDDGGNLIITFSKLVDKTQELVGVQTYHLDVRNHKFVSDQQIFK